MSILDGRNGDPSFREKDRFEMKSFLAVSSSIIAGVALGEVLNLPNGMFAALVVGGLALYWLVSRLFTSRTPPMAD